MRLMKPACGKASMASVLLLLIALAGAAAQRLEFEVVSVKPGDPNKRGGVGSNANRFAATDASLRQLLRFAFDVRDFQISGGPEWIDSAKFTIQATVPSTDTIPPGVEGLTIHRRMAQALMADRFKLSARKITREEQVYELVVNRNGSRLKEVTEGGGNVQFESGLLIGSAAPMWLLINQLSQQLGRAVIDKTGLTARYDFALHWTPDFDSPAGRDAAGAAAASGPSVFAAVQDDLGLRLVSTRGPVEVLVIDHVEKPDPN